MDFAPKSYLMIELHLQQQLKKYITVLFLIPDKNNLKKICLIDVNATIILFPIKLKLIYVKQVFSTIHFK